MKNEDKNKKDQQDFSETRVLERLTDASYDNGKEPEPSKEPENEENETETRILERLTDPQPGEEKTEEPVKKEEPKKIDEKPESAGKEMLSFLRDLIICVVAVFLITNFIVNPVQVKGSSMYPTLEDKSVGFSNIIGLNTSGINRFDIVIVYVAEKDEYLVKRVIGLPGETVSYKNGQLYIDGQTVAEDFLDQNYVESYDGAFMSDVSPITLADDEYYCLGDNRPHSSDSRYYGPFKRSNIRSKGIFIIWPFSDFGAETW